MADATCETNDAGKLECDAPENLLKDALEGRSFSFSPKLNGFDLEHARALMQCSALTYLHPDDIHRIAEKNWKLPYVDIHSRHNSRAVLLGNDNFLIIAFRGSDNIEAIMDSANYFPTGDSKVLGEPVHGQYFQYLNARDVFKAEDQIEGPHHGEAMWDAIKRATKTYLQEHPGAHGHVFLTGHSLGGSVALLAAGDLIEEEEKTKPGDEAKNNGQVAKDLCALYTFGQARVGGKDFIQKIDEHLKGRYFRVANRGDRLSEYPYDISGFEHGGHKVELSASGEVCVDGRQCVPPNECMQFSDGQGESANALIKGIKAIKGVYDAAVCFVNTHKLHHKPLTYLSNLEFAMATRDRETPDNAIIQCQQDRFCCEKEGVAVIS